MKLFINKRAKDLCLRLVLVLVLGIIFSQALWYINAVRFKNAVVEHDYEIAGYLSQKHPELSFDIQQAFTSDKSSSNFEQGKALLEQSGYRKSTELNLIPVANRFFRTGRAEGFISFLVLSLAVLAITYTYLKVHYAVIDRYSADISKIMDGDTGVRLDDNGEGSLAKLAASVNAMASSLYSHIQREKQSRVFLKDVLTDISHQLKTPLSALFMYNEIMQDENAGSKVTAEFLEKSRDQLVRMHTLISNLLKLARLDAGIIKLNKNEHVLDEIIEQAARGFETRLKKEQKSLEIKARAAVPCYCDREWLLEVFSNLIKNAVEHTSPGNRIEVLIEETPLLLRITVRDDGEGIHPDDINHIFKRFYRSRFSQNKQGTGVGLNLVKTVVEMHGGFISVESEPNKGTGFTVYLPNLQNCKV